MVDGALDHASSCDVLAEGIVASDLTFGGDLRVVDAHLELGIVAIVLTQVIFISGLMLRVGCRNASGLIEVAIGLIIEFNGWLQRLLFFRLGIQLREWAEILLLFLELLGSWLRLLLFAHILLDVLVDIKGWNFNHVVPSDRLRFRSLAARKLDLVALVVQFLPQSIFHFGRSVHSIDFIWSHDFALLLGSVWHRLLYSRLLLRTYLPRWVNLNVINIFHFNLTIILRIDIVASIRSLDDLAVSSRLDPASIDLLTVLADLASGQWSYLGSFLGCARSLSDGLSGALSLLDE